MPTPNTSGFCCLVIIAIKVRQENIVLVWQTDAFIVSGFMASGHFEERVLFYNKTFTHSMNILYSYIIHRILISYIHNVICILYEILNVNVHSGGNATPLKSTMSSDMHLGKYY